MMETAAEFNETQIRTYGFNLQKGLILFDIYLPHNQIGIWGQALSALSETEFRFEWVAGRSTDPQTMHLSLLCDSSCYPDPGETLHRTLSGFSVVQIIDLGPVDVISFHGPHYGDRYGIADCTISTLRQHNITIIGMTCAIAGISIVLPPGIGERAKEVLSTVFEIPRTTSSIRRKNREN